MENTDTPLKMISLLMQYPDNRFFAQLPELEAVLKTMAPGRFKTDVRQFLEYLRMQPLIRIQESYTAAFDLNPATSLNMTFHRWGDSEKRAAALTRLQQTYLDAGYEKTTGELPDYLPLLLEFMAVCPAARTNEQIRECL